MNNAQIDVAGFAIFFFYMLFHSAIERFFITGEMGGQSAARFGDGQAMVVFVQNFKARQGHKFGVVSGEW
jgi:hypothetical protein